MKTSQATIDISNLRLRTFIGFNPEETVKKQDIVINIAIRYQLQPMVFEDRVESALNYKNITKSVINHVEQGSFLLLEKLTGDILELCTDFPQVDFARVTVDKPNALRFADSVSLTLEYQADVHNSTLLLEKAS